MNHRTQSALFYTLHLVPTAFCWANVRDLHMQYLRGRAILNDTSKLNQAYDFIITGGETVGLVLASRLSEDSNHTVLVLEAGVLEMMLWDVPGNAFTHSFLGTDYDWDYKTVLQPKANNRTLYWPRGKVLGGSSAVNGLYLVRPSQIEHDTWANLIQSKTMAQAPKPGPTA